MFNSDSDGAPEDVCTISWGAAVCQTRQTRQMPLLLWFWLKNLKRQSAVSNLTWEQTGLLHSNHPITPSDSLRVMATQRHECRILVHIISLGICRLTCSAAFFRPAVCCCSSSAAIWLKDLAGVVFLQTTALHEVQPPSLWSHVLKEFSSTSLDVCSDAVLGTLILLVLTHSFGSSNCPDMIFSGYHGDRRL